MNALLFGIAWAGMVMLFDFSMWTGGIMEWYYNIISKWHKIPAKILGTCKPCFCFWWGAVFYYLKFGVNSGYFVFLGISEMIMIFYVIVLLFYKIISKKEN
jgi:hypothetical protein